MSLRASSAAISSDAAAAASTFPRSSSCSTTPSRSRSRTTSTASAAPVAPVARVRRPHVAPADVAGRALTFFTEDDKSHAGELQRVLREGNHEIPEALKAFGSVIKKATHGAYGAHFRTDISGTATKKRFD